MSITTSQKITKYYQLFQRIDVIFTKEVIHVTGLVGKQVFLKCVGEQWPCIIYSSSFQGAKIIASLKPMLHEKIEKANNLVSLRFSFKVAEKADPVTFFVSARVVGFAPYNKSDAGLQFIALHYTQRPPDDLIEIIGRLLEANVNSAKRKDDRILLTPDSMRRISLLSKDTVVTVQGIKRKCILRDLSFSGAKAIIMGVGKFLLDKPCSLRIELEEPRDSLDIAGEIIRYEDVEGRKDLSAVAIHYVESQIPMAYKLRMNDYLTQFRISSSQDPDEV